MTDENVLKLKHPITTGAGVKLDKLQIKPLTRGDIKAAQKQGKDDVEQEDILLSRLTGMVPEDLDLLHVGDSRRLQEKFRAMVDD